MNEDYLVKAIQKLKPSSEFSFTENDYSTIQWQLLEGAAPTQAEIDVEIKNIKAEEKAAEVSKAAAKVAAEAKLAAIGLTTDDLKALGL